MLVALRNRSTNTHNSDIHSSCNNEKKKKNSTSISINFVNTGTSAGWKLRKRAGEPRRGDREQRTRSTTCLGSQMARPHRYTTRRTTMRCTTAYDRQKTTDDRSSPYSVAITYGMTNKPRMTNTPMEAKPRTNCRILVNGQNLGWVTSWWFNPAAFRILPLDIFF